MNMTHVLDGEELDDNIVDEMARQVEDFDVSSSEQSSSSSSSSSDEDSSSGDDPEEE